ncbi:hypothetical protein C8T65DRAFT_746847 [Cerioporus squamosus]|nr:hypothetical protein C8T65DRAFT_746847 [Cerioporus squamosus]
MARIQCGSSTRDLFHYFNEDLPDKPPSYDLQPILSVVFCLATNAQAYAELQAEFDKFFPAGEDFLSALDVKEMHYLSAKRSAASTYTLQLQEAGHPRKFPQGASPVAVGSLLPPSGTSFWIHVYSMHRDPHNFTHPDAFWPDHWLVASGRAPLVAAAPLPSALSQPATMALTHNESAFLPFSHA